MRRAAPIAALLVAIAVVFFWWPQMQPIGEIRATEVPRTLPPKRVVLIRPAAPSQIDAPPDDTPPQPRLMASLDDLPREVALDVRNASGIALGAAVAACDEHTPPGLLVIAVVTLDPQGLSELELLDGSNDAAPLDLPQLSTCLDGVLWDRDWPTTSDRTRFGLTYSGSSP